MHDRSGEAAGSPTPSRNAVSPDIGGARCCDPDLIRVMLMMACDNAGLPEGDFSQEDRQRVRRHFQELIIGGYARGLIMRSGRSIEYAELFALTPEGNDFARELWPERTWNEVRRLLRFDQYVPLAVLRRGVAAAARAT